MEFPACMQIRHQMYLQEAGVKHLIPAWARATLWLGWWARRWQLPDSRILAVTVLPSRELAAMFASLGCVIAGAQQFDKGFSWDDLVALPEGSSIFWKIPGIKARYEGVVLQPLIIEGQLLATVRIEQGRPRERGTVWSFSQGRFAECIFSEVCLPTRQGSQVMESAFALLHSVGVQVKRSWLWSAGIEASLRTNMTRFWNALEGLEIGAADSGMCPAEDALCSATADQRRNAKVQVASAIRAAEKASPVHILDGIDAFQQVRDIGSGNVVVILDRAEYSPEVHNFLLNARSFSRDLPLELLESVPERFPPGFELSAFVLPWE
jgi:hypothetical protein